MDVTSLLKGQAEPIEQRSIIRGHISNNRPAPTGFTTIGSQENYLWVIVPGYAPNVPFGPCDWAAIHGSTLPAQGAQCVLGFDEANKPIVLWWEGNQSERGIAKLTAGLVTVTAPTAKVTSAIQLTILGTPIAVSVKERKAGSFIIEATGASSAEVAWLIQ